MLVQNVASAENTDSWKIIFLSNQKKHINIFKQQLAGLEFNAMCCRIYNVKTPREAIDLLNQQDVVMLVIALEPLEKTLLELRLLSVKSSSAQLLTLVVTADINNQQNLINTLQADLVIDRLQSPQLAPLIMSGLKRYHDSSLLHISQSLLREMTQIDEASTGNAYLKDLAQSIAKFLGTNFVVIGETDKRNDAIVNTRVVWVMGEYKNNFTYERAGTPCEQVLQYERVITHPKNVLKAFPEDEMLGEMGIESYMGTAIHSACGDLTGILITMDNREMVNHQVYEPVLDFFASRIGVEIERQQTQDKLLQINEELEAKVKLRTEELENNHRRLLQVAHQAGMADIAAGILHNIGNVFNSIGIACQLMKRDFSQSRLSRLTDISEMLVLNKDDLVSYLTVDEKGKQLTDYIQQLSQVLTTEAEKHKKNLQSIVDNGVLVQEVIRNQLDYANLNTLTELCKIDVLVDKALLMQVAVMEKYQIKIEKHYDDVPMVYLQEHKFIHVLTNLFKNAHEAMQITSPNSRKLMIKINHPSEHVVEVEISDNGPGISEDKKQKIFSLGFSTKNSGHGIGLHVSSNYMQEMRGRIRVDSDGSNAGARFTLSLPTSQ